MFYLAGQRLSNITTGLCSEFSPPNCENASVTQGVVCFESDGVCVEACETLSATDDAYCKSYGTNCKLNDAGDHCEFAATCADVQVHQGAYVNGPCSPNMVLGVDCRIAENTDGSLVCFEDYVFAEECWDYSIDQQCPPSNTGVQCYVYDSACMPTCQMYTIKVTEDEVCRSFGPNCKLSSAGTHCELADTCSDILPPGSNGVIGDYCAPNMVTREDCFVTASTREGGFVCSNVKPSV